MDLELCMRDMVVIECIYISGLHFLNSSACDTNVMYRKQQAYAQIYYMFVPCDHVSFWYNE